MVNECWLFSRVSLSSLYSALHWTERACPTVVLMVCLSQWLFQPEECNEVFIGEGEGGVLSPRPSLSSDRHEYRNLAAVPRLSRPFLESKVYGLTGSVLRLRPSHFQLYWMTCSFYFGGGGAEVCIASNKCPRTVRPFLIEGLLINHSAG